jgi:hypothetical protein
MADGNHAFLSDRLANYGEALPANFAVGGDIVGNVPIKFVDLVSRHELIDLDCMRAFNRDRLNVVIGYFDMVAVADLIALDDIAYR